MKFEKRDEVKYIGHLDTMRTFTRCIKKTNLPIKFSNGFNPRVQLAFALPLAVGVTSECEFFDLELNGDVECEKVIKELNQNLPEGFRVVTCEKLEKAKGLMSLVVEAEYEVTFLLSNADVDDLVSKLNNIFEQDEILVNKSSKNGKEEQVNIKDLIIDYSIIKDSYNALVIRVHCFAGSKSNLNPNFIVQVAKEVLNDDIVDDYYIHRKKLILQ
jgi:radical SAM-linked protein